MESSIGSKLQQPLSIFTMRNVKGWKETESSKKKLLINVTVFKLGFGELLVLLILVVAVALL